MVLIKFKTNWADEMDINGFKLVTESHATLIKEKLPLVTDPFTQSFGTNEFNEYDSGQELLDELSFVKLDCVQLAILDKHFGTEYGTFPYLEDIINEFFNEGIF